MSGRAPALLAVLIVASSLLGGCPRRTPRDQGPIVPVEPEDLPRFVDDLDRASLRTAVMRTLPAYGRAGDAASAIAANRLLDIVEGTSDPAARGGAVTREFVVVRVRKRILLTAYFEPELPGRLVRDARFRHPLYAAPPELAAGSAGRTGPYLSRAEIDGGALAGRGLELAWVDDPIALFVLHVQGSGRLRLADGRILGVRYAGSNGRPYTSLGRVLVERGLLPEGQASLADIRRYLESVSPADRAALMAANERFIFFERAAVEGAVGSLGVKLTAGRSIATDPRLVPPGTLAYLATPTHRRFVVSQDTGSAVTGAHADLFVGAGAGAEELAGSTKDRGTLYLLLPRLGRPGH